MLREGQRAPWSASGFLFSAEDVQVDELNFFDLSKSCKYIIFAQDSQKKLYLIVCQNRIREFQFYGNDLATMQIHWYAVLCYI